jgi:hypothetical protein
MNCTALLTPGTAYTTKPPNGRSPDRRLAEMLMCFRADDQIVEGRRAVGP